MTQYRAMTFEWSANPSVCLSHTYRHPHNNNNKRRLHSKGWSRHSLHIQVHVHTHTQKKVQQICWCHQKLSRGRSVTVFKLSSMRGSCLVPSGRTAARLVLCARAAQTATAPWPLTPHPGKEISIYSRKLSRVRQVAILGGGLVTFFLLAFISGRISDKGDWSGVLG